MLPPGRFCTSILIFLGAAVAAGQVSAQPHYNGIWTVEARVGEADQVIVGTIGKVSRQTLVAPGGTDMAGVAWPDGKFAYTLTLKVGETLKGNLKGTVADLRAQATVGADPRYEQWMTAGTSMLWFLGPTPERGQRRDWGYLPLGGRVPAEGAFRDHRRGPHFSRDFRLLKDHAEVLACARAHARTTPDVQETHSIHIPAAIARANGPLNYLIVPVEPTLERRAKRLIAAPQEFMPKGDKPDPSDLRMLRFGGVDSLWYFKSDANAGLLRSLLDEPPEQSDARPICVRAYEVLLHWGVETRLPKSAPAIRSLDLAGTDVTDRALKQVAELRNLTKLDLQDTKVTDQGLKELAGLKKLTELGLAESQLSDANLCVLRQIGLLHCLEQASAGPKRPRSAEEITALALCRSPVTDVGLRELAALPSLTWLDLRDTRVTDVGLKGLAGRKNLATLLLQGTQVSDAGVAELYKALPKCAIRRGSE
jgi:hypothetical protein